MCHRFLSGRYRGIICLFPKTPDKNLWHITGRYYFWIFPKRMKLFITKSKTKIETIQ